MKTLMLKSGMSGRLTLGHPFASVGFPKGRYDVCNFRIENIPDNVPDIEVIRLAGGTAFIGWVSGNPRYIYDFEELGIGRILGPESVI